MIPKKVTSGESFTFPASLYNELIDLIQERRSSRFASSIGGVRRQSDSNSISIKNGSGADIKQFEALHLAAPIFPPSENSPDLSFFTRSPSIGVRYASGYTPHNFVVAAEPIADGEMGRAFASGICAARMLVKHDSHPYYLPSATKPLLQTSGTLGAPILWMDPVADSSLGGEYDLDVRWALVALSRTAWWGGPHFTVLVTQTGGSPGTNTTQCSYTYTVNDVYGVQLATARSPARRTFTKGAQIAGASDALGVAYYDKNGNLVLLDASERPNMEAC